MESNNIKLGQRERNQLFKKYYTEFKVKVIFNWFELFATILITFFGSFKIIKTLDIANWPMCAVYAAICCIILSSLMAYIRCYKLFINRFDKENIYKRVSTELIEKSKGN